MDTDEFYDAVPDINDLWIQWSKSRIENPFHAFEEFIDNSISNLIHDTSNKQPCIEIIINKCNTTNTLEFTIIDNGTGITNIEQAFKYSSVNKNKSHTLNEHGVGMKNALAWCDPTNSNWSIRTKTSTINEYVLIEAPYTFPQIKSVKTKKWLARYKTGTIINIKKISYDKIKRVYSHNYGGWNIKKFGKYLIEELSVVYDGVLERFPQLYMTVLLQEDGKYAEKIKRPNMKNFIHKPHHIYPLREKLDGINEVEIYIDKYIANTSNEFMRYYTGKGTKDNGIEYRSNGRMIENNMFSPFTLFDNHPSRSGIYYRINVCSTNKDGLPSTYSTKNKLNTYCTKFERLCEIFQREVTEQMFGTIKENTKIIENEQIEQFYKRKCILLKSFIDDNKIKILSPHTPVKIAGGKEICPDIMEIYKNTLTIYEIKINPPTQYDILNLFYDALRIVRNKSKIKKVVGIFVSTNKCVDAEVIEMIKTLKFDEIKLEIQTYI